MPLILYAPKKKPTTIVSSLAKFDPYWPSVSTLQHGGDNWLGIVDAAGQAPQTNAMRLVDGIYGNFGYFNGSSYLSITNSNDFNFGSSDFTFEIRILPANITQVGTLIQRFTTWNTNVDFHLSVEANASVFWVCGNATVIYAANVIQQYEWNHIAVVRLGSNISLYVNGVSVGSVSFTGNLPYSPTRPFRIGANGTGVNAFTGYVDSIRITKAARYTANFVPSTGFRDGTDDTYWGSTVLAISFETGLVDLIGHSITNTGIAVFNSGKFNKGLYSNGTVGSKLTYPLTTAGSSMDLATGSPDFTVECWFLVNGFMPSGTESGTSFIACWGNGYGSYSPIEIYFAYDGTLTCAINKANAAGNAVRVYTAAGAIQLYTWYHVAFCKSGNTYSLYLNGVFVSSTTSATGMFLNTATPWTLCQGSNNTYKLNGCISEFRMTKGVARYTSNFTVPTARFFDMRDCDLFWDNTAILMHLDSSTDAKGHIFTNNDVTFQTDVTRYVSKSAYFNGTSGYLMLPSTNDVAFGTGDFTVECWIYPLSFGGATVNNGIIDMRNNNLNNLSGTLYFYNTGASVNWYVNGVVAITGTAIPLKCWSHIAVSRVSGNTRMFINGVQVGSTYTDNNSYIAAPVCIGRMNDGSGITQFFNGYMSDVRITKGAGRYVNKFPRPDCMLPDAPNGDPYWYYTSLLMDFEAGIKDLISGVTYTGATVQTDAAISSNVCSFNGSQYLSIPQDAKYNFGTGDFTIECRFKLTGDSAPDYSGSRYAALLSSFGTANVYGYQLLIGGNTTTTGTSIAFATKGPTGTNYGVGYTTTINKNQWYRVAVTRYKGVAYLFLDGVLVATNSVDMAITIQTNNNLYIGSAVYSSSWLRNFIGAIDDIRITKGVARYRGNYTPAALLTNSAT